MCNFSETLKKYRILQSHTQSSMANLLGMTPNAYQKYELGTRVPKLDVLIKIADAFEISLDELVGRKLP